MPKTTTDRRPRILVLEGLSGAANCVRRSGGRPITVSPHDLAAVDTALAETFDGLLLTGGGDVDPRLYGEKPHKQVYGVNETRDYAEWIALDRAAELGVPVMGICRGHQLMAVHNGGRLRQHLTGHRGTDHPVFAERGSRFGRTIGRDGAVFVSLHHQVVLRHGDGWRVAGRAGNGEIEAIESRDGRCLGVQFHPEMDYGTNEPSRRLFDWLCRESARRAGLPKPERMRVEWKSEIRSRAKRREPGQRQLPASRGQRPVTVSWLCPTCAIRFDSLQDREDHVYWFHGNPELVVAEPPPGHPDWL